MLFLKSCRFHRPLLGANMRSKNLIYLARRAQEASGEGPGGSFLGDKLGPQHRRLLKSICRRFFDVFRLVLGSLEELRKSCVSKLLAATFSDVSLRRSVQVRKKRFCAKSLFYHSKTMIFQGCGVAAASQSWCQVGVAADGCMLWKAFKFYQKIVQIWRKIMKNRCSQNRSRMA